MRTEALRAEQVQQRRRGEIRAMVVNLGPGQFISRDGGLHVRTGMPISHDDAVRAFRPHFPGPECEDCGRDRWTPITRVSGKDRDGHEKLADRLLCRACGHEKPDDREVIEP